MNPNLPYFSRYNYKWNPRKWKSINYNNVFNPTMLYGGQIFIEKGPIETNWINKVFIPYRKNPSNPDIKNYVREEDIAKFSGMYRYRVLFGKIENGEFILQSKPRIENEPLRMNILLDQNNIIFDVLYF